MSDLKSLLERADRAISDVPLPADGLDRLERRRDHRRRNQRVIAGIVGLSVFVAAVWIVTTREPDDRTRTPGSPGPATGPSVTGPPGPTIAPEAGGIVGLPAPGATPSAPEHGRLVLSLNGNVGVPGVGVWVYADGRVIWAGDGGGYYYLPPGAPTEGATGFVEQHLTPAGVEFLQTQVLSTGLFEHDLRLLIDRAGFLGIEARDGDRLVQVTWAWDGIVGKDAPSATPEQTIALEGIYALLSDPASWPSSAWADREPRTYVPSQYLVWLRVLPDQGDDPPLQVGEREVGLLPTAAVDILRHGTEVRHATYELTTDDVRAFAQAFNEARLEPWAIEEAVLRYRLQDPFHPGNTLYVYVDPVLPHGEVVVLGPG